MAFAPPSLHAWLFYPRRWIDHHSSATCILHLYYLSYGWSDFTIFPLFFLSFITQVALLQIASNSYLTVSRSSWKPLQVQAHNIRLALWFFDEPEQLAMLSLGDSTVWVDTTLDMQCLQYVNGHLACTALLTIMVRVIDCPRNWTLDPWIISYVWHKCPPFIPSGHQDPMYHIHMCHKVVSLKTAMVWIYWG